MDLRKSAVVAASLLCSAGVAEWIVRLAVPVRNVGPAFSIFDPVYGRRLKADRKSVV